MHIEIGILPQDKLVMAAVAATGLLAVHAKPLLTNPANWLRTALAAVFFSILMQLWHLPVGPSELHLVGAIPIYLLFGCWGCSCRHSFSSRRTCSIWR